MWFEITFDIVINSIKLYYIYCLYQKIYGLTTTINSDTSK